MIKKLRKKIDILDKKIIKLLERRFNLADQISKQKEKLNLSLTDYKREAEILNRINSIIQNKILKENIDNFYQLIFEITKKNRILNKNQIQSFSKIGIIGLGVIGGSIIKAIKIKNPKIEIYTISRDDYDIKLAKKEGYLKNILDIQELIKKVDLIILATPIEFIIPLAYQIKKYENLRTTPLLIIDTGSIKEKIAKEFERLTSNKIEFLATHPMAGSEKSGFKFSKSDLFVNYPWIITPHRKNKKESIIKITQFIEYLGSIVKIMSAKKHDKIMAKISHLILLISTLIFAYVYDTGKKYIQFSGTSFKTVTRLASANPYMQNQILINNYFNILKELNNFLNYAKKNKINPQISLKFFKKYKKLRDKIYKIF